MSENGAYVDGEEEKFQTPAGFENSDLAAFEIPKPYAGMPKEVLLHYSRQKKFVYTRNIFTAAVLLALLLLISLIISFIAISPPCQLFWQTSPTYEIFPRLYKDSDGDGIGDLKGIEEKLDYISETLGIKTIILRQCYKSSTTDNSYGAIDFKDIDPSIGTLEDMISLITKAHSKGMYIILDFVPNHTSELHHWFNASSNPNHEDHQLYKDFYIWSQTLPNNWQTVTDGDGISETAWTKSPERKEFYYHAYHKSLPDLNFRNENVSNALKDQLQFWLDKNIDGFSFDSVSYLYESKHLRDQTLKIPTDTVSYDNMYPDFTQNLAIAHDLMMTWRSLLDDYSTEPGVYRVMNTETGFDKSVQTMTRFYGNSFTKEADVPMNLRLLQLNADQWTASKVYKEVIDWMQAMPKDRWPNWRLGTYKVGRILSRVNENLDLAKSLAVITMTMSGTAGIYYGEELGMTNLNSNPVESQVHLSPMQWTSETNAGFTRLNSTQIDVNENYKSGVNVEDQLGDKNSFLNLYKSLISLRGELVFLRGYICFFSPTENLFAYVREMDGLNSILVAVNLSPSTINVEIDSKGHFPSKGIVKHQINNDMIENSINMNSFSLNGYQSVVIEYKDNRGRFHSNKESLTSCFTSRSVCQNSIGLLQDC